MDVLLATKFHVSLHFRFYNNGQRLFGSGIICDQKRQNQNAVFRENANLFTFKQLNRLLKAAHFAARKHANQRRKDAEESPYINHPLEVAEHLARVGEIEDEEILMAALLHDTIEDTETTKDEIASASARGCRNTAIVVI